MKKIIFLAFSSLLLVACAPSSLMSVPDPTDYQLRNTDYGSPISQDKARQKVKQYLSNKLLDPFSTQYQWGGITKDWLKYQRTRKKPRVTHVHEQILVFGYILEVKINTKNSFGAYTGFQTYIFVFYNGAVKSAYKIEDSKYGPIKIIYWG